MIFEDDDLLVVNKPAGLNTHSPGPFAGEGIYEWLRRCEPRWSRLAIIHRLDKETSGVMVFGKTTTANRSLTDQFTQHAVRKKYLLLTDRPVKSHAFTVVSTLARAGEKYVSRKLQPGGERAETHFHQLKPLGRRAESASRERPVHPGKVLLLEAEPVTGRTHQIRAQAAAEGFPVLGDTLYGGTPAPRVCLHSTELTLKHPVTSEVMTFVAPADFEADARMVLRTASLDLAETNAFRLIHGAADGWPGWQVERLGEFLLSQSATALDTTRLNELRRLLQVCGGRGAYHKILTRHARRTAPAQASPQLALGDPATGPFFIRENGLQFELSFAEGYSTGLFLDQRENRRSLIVNRVLPDFPIFAAAPANMEVLNTFAYTCGFSVCAAKAGVRVTSLDLSRKYLEWGKRNFALNGLDPARHDFIHGDVFDWLRRLAKKGRAFDLIILDPPTFSQSKQGGTFQAETDYGRLVAAALPLLKPNGILFTSTNAARLLPEEFLATLVSAIKSGGRRILTQHYVPQPVDFPIHRDEPAHLKTVWTRVG